MTTSAYAPLTEAEQVFKDLIWTPMITAGENWLEAEVPFLDLPIIKQLDETTLQTITDAIYAQICLLIDVGSIQLVNAENQAAYDAASENLVVVGAEQGVNSDAYKAALAKSLAELSAFTHLSGQ